MHRRELLQGFLRIRGHDPGERSAGEFRGRVPRAHLEHAGASQNRDRVQRGAWRQLADVGDRARIGGRDVGILYDQGRIPLPGDRARVVESPEIHLETIDHVAGLRDRELFGVIDRA